MEMKGTVGISLAQVSGHVGGREEAEERLGSGPPPLPSQGLSARCRQLCPTTAHGELLVYSKRCLVPWQGL